MADVVAAHLAVRDLRFRYKRGSEELFDGLCHDFVPGQVTALTGSSGRGKSTLLYILGLLLTPQEGCVEIEGRDVTHLPDRERSAIRAQQIGFVFQDSELDTTRSVLDSVIEPALYAGVRREDAEKTAMSLLHRFGLEHRATHKPGEVSGGQAQRLALCRALVNHPSMILADEPTGNLDRENAALVLDVLNEVAAEGRTVIVATHDPFVMDQAHHVLSLDIVPR